MNYSNRWEKSFSNAYLFKPLNYLCPKDKEICKNQLNGEIYMFDRDHLNFYGGKIYHYPFSITCEPNIYLQIDNNKSMSAKINQINFLIVYAALRIDFKLNIYKKIFRRIFDQ